MTNSTLTTEIVHELEMNYAPWGKDKTVTDTQCGTGVWEYVDSTDQGYDEGTVTTQLVWRHVESGALWAIDYDSNSWGDYYDVTDIYPCVSAEKTITVYNRA